MKEKCRKLSFPANLTVRGGSTIKKLSDQLDDKLEQDENYRMARKYMNMYTDSMVDEYRFRKENKVLIEKLDEMVDALHEVRDELSDVKRQNSQLSLSMRYLDFTQLRISMDGRSPEELSALRQSMPEDRQQVMPLSDEEAVAPDEEPPITEPPLSFTAHNISDPMPGMPNIRIVPPPPRTTAQPPPQGQQPPAPWASAAAPQAVPPTTASAAPRATAAQQPTGKNKLFAVISNVLFYFCMIMLIVSAISFAQNEDVNKSLFGFRYYYIKSASMVPVYPVGSIVLTRVADPQEIQVGDDVTVYVGAGKEDTYVTHRVVEITTDQAGELAFRTKGVNNKANDPSPYNAKLVVGRVVFCIPVLGTIMIFVQNQLWLVIVMFVLLMALSFMLRMLFSKDTDEQAVQQPAVSAPKHGRFYKSTHKVTPTTADSQPPA